MYNRYIRNDRGVYTRIPQEETASPPPQPVHVSHEEREPETEHRDPPPNPAPKAPPRAGTSGQLSDALTGTLRHILDQLHLDHVDPGDLLLLGLLFFLFREDADEELLVALGLLLIL